jgi:hypothetical protein
MIASLLERIFDPMSRRRRAMVVQPGRRCLEVGAGHGSMADWMAEQVGPGGRVVATDIDAGYLRGSSAPTSRSAATTSWKTRSRRWGRSMSSARCCCSFISPAGRRKRSGEWRIAWGRAGG